MLKKRWWIIAAVLTGVGIPLLVGWRGRGSPPLQKFATSDQILAELAELPVYQWSYRWSPHIRHIGPLAQDFRRAYGLGSSPRVINMVDAFGVLLAALQALNTQVRDLTSQLPGSQERKMV